MALIDSFTEGAVTETYIQNAHPSSTVYDSAAGQVFRPTSSYKLTSVKFKFRKSSGNPQGVIKAYLYATTGTLGESAMPTGDPLATSTTELATSSVTTTSTYYEFEFDGTYTLVANTTYCICIYSTDADYTASKYLKVAYNSSGGHEGNAFKYDNSAWDYYITRDLYFYVYGDGPLLDAEVEVNQFPDNVANSVTAAAIESWLDGLSITTVKDITINWQGGFYKVVVTYE